MKTRSEMIYDFMLALCANHQFFGDHMTDENCAVAVYEMAAIMADKYLENL